MIRIGLRIGGRIRLTATDCLRTGVSGDEEGMEELIEVRRPHLNRGKSGDRSDRSWKLSAKSSKFVPVLFYVMASGMGFAGMLA
jgi:hypothetical protein